MDILEKDLAASLYSESCGANGSMQHIGRGFSNPLFKLSFESPVYVRLSKLLRALYSTQNQAFLLIPSDEVVPRTGSLGSKVNEDYVSGDHCQGGTEKRVYHIVVCGNGSDKCYPVRSDIEFIADSDVRPRMSENDYSRYKQRYSEEMQISRLARENFLIEEMAAQAEAE